MADKLRCAECHRLSDERAVGWRALHGREEPEDQPETIVFLPGVRGAGVRRVVAAARTAFS